MGGDRGSKESKTYLCFSYFFFENNLPDVKRQHMRCFDTNCLCDRGRKSSLLAHDKGEDILMVSCQVSSEER